MALSSEIVFATDVLGGNATAPHSQPLQKLDPPPGHPELSYVCYQISDGAGAARWRIYCEEGYKGFSVESGATKFTTFPGNQVIKSAQGYNLGEFAIALWTQGDYNGGVASYTGAVASLAAPMASGSVTGKWNLYSGANFTGNHFPAGEKGQTKEYGNFQADIGFTVLSAQPIGTD